MVRIHFTLVPEVRVDDQEYGIIADVIFEAVAFKLFANIGGTTALRTIALYIGLPVSRSQTIAVSRWLVIPIAAI